MLIASVSIKLGMVMAMEYLPWVVMAFGLFLLFVTTQSRSNRGRVVGISAKPPSESRATSGRTLQVNSDSIQKAPKLPAPPEAHASAIWMPIVLSLLITGAALVVILLPIYYGEAQQKWAFGIIGLILGYWFKK